MCFGIEGDLTPSVNQWLDFPMRIPVSAGFRSAPMGLRRWVGAESHQENRVLAGVGPA